jgi:hypothetical protein
LKEVEKTVTMLADSKYSEKGVPEMVLAQRDFIKKEVEYFEEECINFAFKMFFVFCFSVAVYVIYFGVNRR